MVEKVKGALRIIAADQKAIRLGLTSGLSLADARARIPDISVHELDRDADARFLHRLAQLCDRFTPTVAIDGDDGLILDLTGCTHLFEGESNVGRAVTKTMKQEGLFVRATIAGSPWAARALARYGNTKIAPIGHDERFVRSLPIAAITRIERATVLALSRAGLKTIGDVADRPPQVLAARFGQELVSEVSRTLGLEHAPIVSLQPSPAVVSQRNFADAFIGTDDLECVLEDLIEDAVLMMQQLDQGGRVFEAKIFRSDGLIRRLIVETGRPSRDGLAILRLYRERLHTLADPLEADFGFEAVRLSVLLTEPLPAAQSSLYKDKTEADKEAFDDLVDRLVVRFGRDRVLGFEIQDTHIPDVLSELGPVSKTQSSKLKTTSRSQVDHPVEAGGPPMFPLHLFDLPQPVEALAEIPDGPPLKFRWRKILHQVVRSEGPERIEPEWWHQHQNTRYGNVRDYFRVEDTAGRRYWIFREGHYGQKSSNPKWFLHGIFA